MPEETPRDDKKELYNIAADARFGKKTRFFTQQGTSFNPVGQVELRKELLNILGKDENERNRKLREENAEFRAEVHRLATALLNKKAIEETMVGWQRRYDEVLERLKYMENVIAGFKALQEQHQQTLGLALQQARGHGPTA